MGSGHGRGWSLLTLSWEDPLLVFTVTLDLLFVMFWEPLGMEKTDEGALPFLLTVFLGSFHLFKPMGVFMENKQKLRMF